MLPRWVPRLWKEKSDLVKVIDHLYTKEITGNVPAGGFLGTQESKAFARSLDTYALETADDLEYALNRLDSIGLIEREPPSLTQKGLSVCPSDQVRAATETDQSLANVVNCHVSRSRDEFIRGVRFHYCVTGFWLRTQIF